MANIWEEFDKNIDTEGLAKDVEEAAENGGRRDVPHDTYEVAINKLELTKSKKGDPMVTCWMKILEGEYKGSLIFMNQVVTQGFQIHIANEFLRSLVSEMANPVDVHFKTYAQYANMIMDVMEAIDNNYEYSVEYGEKKGFNTFEIKEVYVLEDGVIAERRGACPVNAGKTVATPFGKECQQCFSMTLKFSNMIGWSS